MSTEHMNRRQRREEIRRYRKPQYGHKLQPVRPEDWPGSCRTHKYAVAVWRSNLYLVVLWEFPGAPQRLTVNRVDKSGSNWVDGISWDTLQRLKSEAGFGDYDAVEVYPPDYDVVNMANMRHLWIMEQPLQFAWRRGLEPCTTGE